MQHTGHNVATAGFVPKTRQLPDRRKPPTIWWDGRSWDLYQNTEQRPPLPQMRTLKPAGGRDRIWPDGPKSPHTLRSSSGPAVVPARHGGVLFGAARCKARVSSIG
jgi:hypothetical protein